MSSSLTFISECMCGLRMNECVFPKFPKELPAVLVKSNLNAANAQRFYPFKANIDNCIARTRQQETVQILHLTNTRRPVWRCNAMYTGLEAKTLKYRMYVQ